MTVKGNVKMRGRERGPSSWSSPSSPLLPLLASQAHAHQPGEGMCQLTRLIRARVAARSDFDFHFHFQVRQPRHERDVAPIRVILLISMAGNGNGEERDFTGAPRIS